MPVAVRQISSLHRVGIRLLVFLFWFIVISLRVRITPRAKALLAAGPTSSLFLIWHNRNLLSLCGFARIGNGIPLTALVSASGDGAVVTEIVHAFGMEAVRGSSSRRAVEATRELLAVMSSGRNIVIAPDGPRGPIYTVKEGTAQIAREHAAAIYVLGFNCSNIFQLKTWDKFIFPLPFSKLEVDAEKIEVSESITAEMLQSKLSLLNN